MRKILAITLTLLFLGQSSHAATNVSQSAQVTVVNVLSVEFADTSATTFGGGSLPWTNVDPGVDNNLIAPTGADRSGSETAKMDTGVICRFNGSASNWYLKMAITGALAGKIKYYLSQPVNRNTNEKTNGTVVGGTPGSGANWPEVPSSASNVYISGSKDTVNTPFGTFVGISYGLNPVGLQSGSTYTGTITYTITTTA